MGDRTLDSPKFKSDVLQIRAIDAEFDARFGPGNWDLIDVEGNAGKGTWADYDVTGRTMRRAGLDAAIDAVMSTPTNAIGVLNLSRWARNVTAALQRIEELKKLGVYLYSADESVDLLSPEGRFMTGLYLQIAELFSGQKSVAWSRLIELNAEQGKHHGNPPAGYRRSGLREVDGRQFATGDIEPDPAQRDAIIAAFTSYADGASKMKVGRELVNRGVVSSASQARSVLENRAYRRFHGTACGPGCEEPSSHGDRGEIKASDFDELTGEQVEARWLPGRHEGIVEEALFQRVQARLQQSVETTGRRTEVGEVRHPLQGIVRCGLCGRALALDRGTSTGRITTYKDSSGKMSGCPGPGAVAADRLLATVSEYANALVARLELDALKLPAEPHRPTSRNVKALQQKRQRRLDLLVRLQNAIDLEESAEPEVDRARIAPLRAEVDALGEEISAATDYRLRPAADHRKLARQAKKMIEDWGTLDVAQQREVLSSLVHAVYVFPRAKDAAWRQPYEERIRVEPAAAFAQIRA